MLKPPYILDVHIDSQGQKYCSICPLCHHCEETSALRHAGAAAVSGHMHHMFATHKYATKSSDSEAPRVWVTLPFAFCPGCDCWFITKPGIFCRSAIIVVYWTGSGGRINTDT